MRLETEAVARSQRASVLQRVKAGQVHMGCRQREENSWSPEDARGGHPAWGNPHTPQAAHHATGSPNSLIY